MADNKLTIPTEVPDYIVPSNEGFENADSRNFLLPRIVLEQALSPKVIDGSVMAGEVWDSLGNKICDKNNSFLFVPVFHFTEAIEWGTRAAQEGILQRSSDPTSPLFVRAGRKEKTMRNGKEEYAITLYHNFVVFIPPSQSLLNLSCYRTNFKHGNTLLTLARYRGGNIPLYSGRYTAGMKLVSSKGYSFFNWDFGNAGWATKDEVEFAREQYKIISEAYKAQRLVTEVDDVSDEPTVNEVPI